MRIDWGVFSDPVHVSVEDTDLDVFNRLSVLGAAITSRICGPVSNGQELDLLPCPNLVRNYIDDVWCLGLSISYEVVIVGNSVNLVSIHSIDDFQIVVDIGDIIRERKDLCQRLGQGDPFCKSCEQVWCGEAKEAIR